VGCSFWFFGSSPRPLELYIGTFAFCPRPLERKSTPLRLWVEPFTKDLTCIYSARGGHLTFPMASIRYELDLGAFPDALVLGAFSSASSVLSGIHHSPVPAGPSGGSSYFRIFKDPSVALSRSLLVCDLLHSLMYSSSSFFLYSVDRHDTQRTFSSFPLRTITSAHPRCLFFRPPRFPWSFSSTRLSALFPVES